jgi:hypothetical protein
MGDLAGLEASAFLFDNLMKPVMGLRRDSCAQEDSSARPLPLPQHRLRRVAAMEAGGIGKGANEIFRRRCWGRLRGAKRLWGELAEVKF